MNRFNFYYIMKDKLSFRLIALCYICFLAIPFSFSGNYAKNRAPLAEVPYTQLPIGSVRAEGWLLKQLQLQKEGLTGHAESLYSGANDLGSGSDWLGGSGDSWERVPYYTKGLVALAYVMNDEELIEKSKKWIDWSLNNQQPTGYFGPVKNDDWWARMPMLYAIRDYYEATNDSRVIPFLTKYFEYQNAMIAQQPLSSWGKSRAGDNIDVIFWLYNRTGDSFLLDLADKLKAQAYDWTDILTHNKFNHFGSDFQPKHNVNVPQAMKLPVVYSQKSHSEADRNAFFIGREHLHCEHGQPMGMQSGNEMLAGKSSLTGLELCSVVEQMQTSEIAQMILGDVSIGDQLEKVAFNALPGALTEDIKGMQYYHLANQVMSKHTNYNFGQNYDNGITPSPYSGYGCCRFDFHMGWPYFVKTMWAATHDNGLAAMAYGPCNVTALVADNVEVSIKESTHYPFDEQISLTLTTSSSIEFPLKLRIPSWCKNPQIKVNNVLQGNVEPGQFYTINRTWQNGDIVVLDLPMSIVLNDEVNNSVSVQRGPLVYSLKINESKSVREDYGNGFKECEISPASDWNYALIVDKNNPESCIQVNRGIMPENPFSRSATPVTLTVSAKKLPEWLYSFNGVLATDPPFGPVASSEAIEQVTLVPFGSETIRATCLPTVGETEPITSYFTEDFSEGQKGWVQYSGSFYVEKNEYVSTNVTGGHPCAKSLYPASLFSDFTYDAKVQVNSAGDGGLMFRASRLSFGPDEYNGYYVGISNSNKRVELGKATGTWKSLKITPMDIALNQWYQIRIVASGTNIKVYVDDMETPKIDYNDTSFSTGSIGVRSYNALTKWSNISVTSNANVSILPLDVSDKISLRPNPANEYIDVMFCCGKYEIVNIRDLNGSLVSSEKLDNEMSFVRLDTTKFTAGTYIVSIVSDGNESLGSKFIKINK